MIDIPRDEDLNDCFEKWKNKTISDNSWIIDVDEIIKYNYNMIARNPNQQNCCDDRITMYIVKKMYDPDVNIAERPNVA